MDSSKKTKKQLVAELDQLKAHLADTEDTLHAIRTGQVDGLVVETPAGPQLFTLTGTDYTYRILVEQMNEGALTLTLDGHILYSNQCFADLIQRPLQQVIASSIYDYLPSGNSLLLEALLEQVYQGEAGRTEVNLVTPDNPQLPAFISLTRLTLEEETVLCVVVTDLSEQKRNEAIVAAEWLARSILDQATEAIVVCDERRQIIRANQAAHRLGGRNVLMRPFDEIFSLQIDFKTLAERESVTGLESDFVSVTGEKMHLLVSAGLVVSKERERRTFVITLSDITLQKQGEEALKSQAQKLEAQVAQRTQELQRLVDAMAGREVRMADLKDVIRKLRGQLQEAGLKPVADDPLLEDNFEV